MKNLRWSLSLWSVGLATLAAACIDTGSLMRPTGAGGTMGSAGRGGTTGIAGSGGGAGVGGSEACASPIGTYDRCEGICGCSAGGPQARSPVVGADFVTNECGYSSAAVIIEDMVNAVQWGLTARLTQDGTTLIWNNGSRWVRTCTSPPPTRPPSTGIVLTPDTDGMFDGSNAAGVVGGWWSAGDFYSGDTSPGSGPCPQAGFPPESCSTLATPTPGAAFRPDPGGRGMCTTGVAAQILNGSDGQPAYSSIWGNIIGFALASTAPRDAGSDTLGVYDAPAHGITGFAFDIDAVPPGGHIRVAFPTKGTENNAASWRGATNDLSPIVAPGHYEMRWPEIGGPMYLVGAPPFDPKTLEMISFHVVSNISASTSYSFCVNNITLLTN
jgi:hypothetical protein